MPRLHLHPERHLVSRIGWLRAAVLGANDGIVSTASLIVGVAAAAAKQSDILIAGGDWDVLLHASFAVRMHDPVKPHGAWVSRGTPTYSPPCQQRSR